jgi:hypothetical protein
MTAVAPSTAAVHLPELHTTAIEPAALSAPIPRLDPIDQVCRLTQTTLDDSESIIEATIADPAPNVQQVLANQVGYAFRYRWGIRVLWRGDGARGARNTGNL